MTARAFAVVLLASAGVACHGDAVGESAADGAVGDGGDAVGSADSTGSDSTGSDSTGGGDTVADGADTFDPRKGTIACGPLPAATCTIGVEDCCGYGGPTAYTWSCKATGTCGTGLAIVCDGASDCASDQICCATLSGGTFTSTSCQKPTDCCPGGCSVGGPRAFLCDPGGTECTLIGRTCKPSDNLGGSFYTCQT
jgi:hypothetical protein